MIYAQRQFNIERERERERERETMVCRFGKLASDMFVWLAGGRRDLHCIGFVLSRLSFAAFLLPFASAAGATFSCLLPPSLETSSSVCVISR